MTRRQDRKHELLVAAEGAGETLGLLTWILFGAAVFDQTIARISWQACAYAVLSLTVMRMLPVWLALAGSGVTPAGKLFLGWFGPRGLASVVFAVIVLDAGLPDGELLATTVALTVFLSILAHGLTANRFAHSFAGRLGTAAGPTVQEAPSLTK
jgi:NhaP-type Na+/H+ or K+/H+ antiporter